MNITSTRSAVPGEGSSDVVGVVPIKLNSQRAPGKNVRNLGSGPPLVRHILTTMLHVPELTSICVYCSSSEIESLLPAGVRFVERPPDLDRDATLIGEVLESFANDVPAQIYVLAHATSPFLSASSISKAVLAVQSTQYDSALTVRAQQEFTWFNGRPENYSLDEIPRTQDLPIRYVETTGLYVYTHDLLARTGRRVGDSPYLVPVSKIEAIDINDEEDFAIAAAVFEAGKGGRFR